MGEYNFTIKELISKRKQADQSIKEYQSYSYLLDKQLTRVFKRKFSNIFDVRVTYGCEPSLQVEALHLPSQNIDWIEEKYQVELEETYNPPAFPHRIVYVFELKEKVI
jgi:hypothetical protein